MNKLKTLQYLRQKMNKTPIKQEEGPIIGKSIMEGIHIPPKFALQGLLHVGDVLPYQVEGIIALNRQNGRALLADDQGLGKTLQAIGYLQQNPHIKKVLIICPAFLKINWTLEFEYWTGRTDIQTIEGYERTVITENIVIINYDILTKTNSNENTIRKDIWNIDWDCIICDEAHYISNLESIRGWAVKELTRYIQYVILITATPSKHRPKEFFTLANIISEKIFPSFLQYSIRYCDRKRGYNGGWDCNGSSNEEELHKLLSSTIMIRRKKSDVFKNLDKKLRIVVPLEIDNRKEYDKADTGLFSMDKIEELSQLAVKGKMNAVISWINDMLETEDKLVIYCEHKETVKNLLNAFCDISVHVDGSLNDPAKRNAAVTAFQRCASCGVRKERHAQSKCKEYKPDLAKRLFIGTRAAKEGVTLTAAWHVVFVEMWWSPKDHDQAEDRIYGRAGDLHGATAWYLIAHNTIEEYKAKVFDIKNRTLEKVMDGKELSKNDMLTELLKERRRNEK